MEHIFHVEVQDLRRISLFFGDKLFTLPIAPLDQALNPGIRGYEAALQACAQGAGWEEGMHLLMDKIWESVGMGEALVDS